MLTETKAEYRSAGGSTKGHPIPGPNGRAMGCFCEYLLKN